MLNKAILPAFQPHWVSRDRGALPPDHVLVRASRPSLFLHRDLSDEALRQPVPALFSQAELAAARLEGFDEGRAAGLAEAAAAREAAQTASEISALGVIVTAMADSRSEAAQAADVAAEALAKTLVAAMQSVMPELIQRSALGEVGAMLNHVLPGLSREPAVRIEVPVAIADAILAALVPLEQELRDKISVVGVSELKAGDARVSWASGHAVRRPAEVWQAVMEALNVALGHSEAKDEIDGQ